MIWLRTGLLAVALAVLAVQAFVRLAPTDPARWHVTAAVERLRAQGSDGAGREMKVRGIGDWPQPNGFEAVRAIDRPPAAVLAEADRVILSTPRTRRIAGGVEDGMITYLTRSRFWGFPDFTTVSTGEGATPIISIYGRARFGRGDLGVNAARIRGWLEALGLGA